MKKPLYFSLEKYVFPAWINIVSELETRDYTLGALCSHLFEKYHKITHSHLYRVLKVYEGDLFVLRKKGRFLFISLTPKGKLLAKQINKVKETSKQ